MALEWPLLHANNAHHPSSLIPTFALDITHQDVVVVMGSRVPLTSFYGFDEVYSPSTDRLPQTLDLYTHQYLHRD